MDGLFLQIVNMSLAASVTGAAVLLLRALLKRRVPRWIFCLLWALVLVRLLVPFAPPSRVSAYNVIPSARTVGAGRRAALQFVEDPGTAVDFPTLQTPRGTGEDGPAEHPVVAPAKVPLAEIFSAVWICGAALLLLYGLGCYCYTLHRLRHARRLEHTPMIDAVFRRVGVDPGRVRLYVSGLFPSPVVCGLVRPRLVLSGLVEEEDAAHVVAHELTHIRRHDNLWKTLATLALYLHWFNPLVWLFYRWYVTDMEASCDEAVVRRPETDRKAYAYSLVNMAEKSRSAFAGGFLAFGECALKERVKSIMNVKKNTIIITILCVAVVAGLAVVFLTNPQPAPSAGPASGPSGREVPDDVAADMKLTYSVLGSLREKDVAEMWVRYDTGFGAAPEAEIPPDGCGEVISGLRGLTLGWEHTEWDEAPVCIDIHRKDGKLLTVTLGPDSVKLSGTVPKLADKSTKSTVYVYKAETAALRAFAEGLLAGREGEPSLPQALPEGTPDQAAPVQAPADDIREAPAAPPDGLPALNGENPPCLRIPYDAVMEMNLIDRESRTCCAVTGERRGAVLAQLNSLTPQEGLDAVPDETGLRLLQIRLLDGTKYDFWCHSNLLMAGEAPVADASRLRGLYDIFYDIERTVYGANRAAAEWLGYMNPYRVTKMAIHLNAEYVKDGKSSPDLMPFNTYESAASQKERAVILDICKKLKELKVGRVQRFEGGEAFMKVYHGTIIDLDFENEKSQYKMVVLGDRIAVGVDNIAYDLLYDLNDPVKRDALDSALYGLDWKNW